jgi:hypothetical protein
MSDVYEGEISHDDELIGEPMPSRPTRRDLADGKLELLRSSAPPAITTSAGGLSFRNMLEVMDFAKAMSTSGVMLPKYLRGNPGGCLGITFKAIHWRMDPFEVAEKSFVVNDRIGFESQLIHAVIEARAPLQHRLQCEYDGEGQTRSCTITGYFVNGDVREYTSPMLKDIRVKNSPLWKDDPDQQLFYYASRSWARKWCPDTLMGVYTKEELSVMEPPEDEAPGLHARLAGSPRSDEGHAAGHAEAELAQIAAENGPELAQDAPIEAEAIQEPASQPKRTRGRPKGKAKAAKKAEQKQPESAAQYLAFAETWIGEATDGVFMLERWHDERQLRNKLGVTAEMRAPLDALLKAKREELSE